MSDEAELYVPGEFRCAKCGFTLSQFSISATTGQIASRDHPGEKCPNDGSPLWRVTWKQRAIEHHERAIEEMDRANAAEGRLVWHPASEPVVAISVLARYFDDEMGDFVYTTLTPGQLRAVPSPYTEWLPLSVFDK